MEEYNEQNTFNASNVLLFIYKRRVHLLLICAIAFVVSCIVSLCIPSRYKSTVILYPASSGSVSQTLSSENASQKGLLNFGEDVEVEQLMQVLQSNEIRNRIIEKYNLIQHYDIDPESRYLRTILCKKYDNNVTISRTEYTSVQIDVLDESPDTAALIANDISYLLDTVYSRMQKERAYKAFKIVERELEEQQAKVQEIRDSLEYLSNLGVIDVKSQTEMYSEQHAIALASGNLRSLSEIEKKLDILAKYGSNQTILKEQLTEEVKTLSLRKNKYRESKIELEQDLPNAFVVNKAERAERKSYPIRWLIVLVSVVSTFLVALIAMAAFETLKKK